MKLLLSNLRHRTVIICFVMTVAVGSWIAAVSQDSEEPSAVPTKIFTQVFSQSQMRWAADLPPEMWQDHCVAADDVEAASSLATVPELIQDILSGRDIIVHPGN